MFLVGLFGDGMSQFHSVKLLKHGHRAYAVSAKLSLLKLRFPDQYSLSVKEGNLVVLCDTSRSAVKLVQELTDMGATVELR